MMKYEVIDTPMRPKRYKVESVEQPGRNNSWTEYFETTPEAQTECDKRNKDVESANLVRLAVILANQEILP